MTLDAAPNDIGDTGNLYQEGRWVSKCIPGASLVYFERRSSSCRVIRAELLTSCANMSKQKGVLSPFEGSFFNDLSNQTFFCFPLSSGRNGAEAWASVVVPNIVGCCVSSGVWSFCRKYYFLDRVPIWLRGSRLCCLGKLLFFRVTERSYSHGVIIHC